jgi:EmrB/QacA subfamily drug resistance transporter
MPPASSKRPWWILAGACTGLFVLMLDSTVVTLALPSIERDLDASPDGLQWVQNAYLLTLAALVVAMGRLGDILGRRRVFCAGMLAFGAGSTVAALANGEELLVAGRVIQGAGGAALIALSLAITSHAFPDRLQAKALGIWAAVSAVALAIGPLAGGALIEAASWRWIFWVNLPVLATGIAILTLAGEESRDETAPRRVDWVGVTVLGAALTAIVLALIEADEWGFQSAGTLGVLAFGLGLLAVFWWVERRVANPLVDLSLFRNGPYLGASAAGFALVGAYWVVIFFQPQYLQDILGHTAIAAGVLILPITAPMVFFSPLSGRVIGRFGARATMTAGMLCGVAGLVLQARVDADSDYVSLLPGFLLFGISLALVYAPMSTAAMAAMPRAKAGIASGVLAMNRCLAGALLLAISGALFQGSLPDAAEPVASAGPRAFTEALSDALLAPIVVVALGALITWLLVRDPATEAVGAPRGPAEAVSATAELQHHQHHRRFHL